MSGLQNAVAIYKEYTIIYVGYQISGKLPCISLSCVTSNQNVAPSLPRTLVTTPLPTHWICDTLTAYHSNCLWIANWTQITTIQTRTHTATSQQQHLLVDPVLAAVPKAPPAGLRKLLPPVPAAVEPKRPPPVAWWGVVVAPPNKPPPDAVDVCCPNNPPPVPDVSMGRKTNGSTINNDWILQRLINRLSFINNQQCELCMFSLLLHIVTRGILCYTTGTNLSYSTICTHLQSHQWLKYDQTITFHLQMHLFLLQLYLQIQL